MKKKNTALPHSFNFPHNRPHKSKILLFKFIAILLPFIVLILIEFFLRLIGYGNNMKLFKEYELDSHYWIMNDAVSLKYFTNAENATIGFDELFEKEKSPETFRIFVLGESTAQGFPYTYNVAFHRWLKYRLMHTFPEINFEMINVSLTAVNSYTVFDFAKETIKYAPDAILIYVGHNEYYGALGVGSTSKLGNNVYLVRFLMNSRQLRLVQLLSHTANKVARVFRKDLLISDQGLMIRMAANHYIPYGSKKYTKGIEQFETNLNDICRIFSSKKIPVLISNLVSNEKDLRPFISDTTNNNRSAIYQYIMAEHAYEMGDYSLAKELFVKAKDLDMLRFRAPEELNRVIADVTSRYPGVHLVDTKDLFERYSPYRILGKETILEHVHPNIFGDALLSESFYQALKKQGIIVLHNRQEISFKQLLAQMPLTDLDSLKGVYTYNNMMNSWPFNINVNQPDTVVLYGEPSVEGMLANNMALENMTWYNAMALLSKHYEETNNLRKAFRLAESRVLEFPYESDAYVTAARAGIKLGVKSEAVFYLIKAFQLEPDLAKAADITRLLMETDQPEQALPYIRYIIDQDPSNRTHVLLLDAVQEIIALKSSLYADSSNITLLNQIASKYFQTQNKEAALKYNNKALGLDPNNRTSQEILEEINGLPP